MIKGLIFDFDGLILDTETPEFDVWQEIFESYGCHLPIDEWQAALGASLAAFDPVIYLANQIDTPLDREAIYSDHRQRAHALIERQPAQPGIPETLERARARGIQLGVASSSPVYWVHGHLKHIGLFEYFDPIVCKDHVQKIKPDPELFLRCAANMGLGKDEVLVFEDSPNGIRAANAAGIFCVAIPNLLTRQLDISHANLILERIDAIPFEELLGVREAA